MRRRRAQTFCLLALIAIVVFLFSEGGKPWRGALWRWTALSFGGRQAAGLLICSDGSAVADSAGRPVKLRNNSEARDPSWAALREFLKSNTVNEIPYQPGRFVCTEYALKLHDDAEAAGLRCAFVYVTFEEGDAHTLNAFQTTDHGLVYIDCTGTEGTTARVSDYDTVAYLLAGHEYGRLPLDSAVEGLTDYYHYAAVKAQWDKAHHLRAELEKERELLVERSRQWDSEREALTTRMAQAGTPGERKELAARIAQANQEAEALRAEQVKFNAKVGRFQAQRENLIPFYRINLSRIKTVDIWW
jgi:hypothetical protein